MTRAVEYKVRPSSRNDAKDLFNVFLSPANFLQMNNGDICNIETSQGVVGPVIVWSATEKIKDDVIQTSRALQKMYGVKPESRISISRSNQLFGDAVDITLHEITLNYSEAALLCSDEDDRSGWAWLLKIVLREADMLTPGQVFENIRASGQKRSFQIQSINSSEDRAPYRAHSCCKVRITDETVRDEKQHNLFASSKGIGGLTTQFGEINDKLQYYNEPLHPSFPRSKIYRPCNGGIILHGAQGTGKSLVLRKIAEAGWKEVFHLDSTLLNLGPDETRAIINRTFSNALRSQPSVIIIDDLASIAGKNNTEESRQPYNIGKLLSQQLELLRGSRTLVVGAARKLSDLNQSLRAARHFLFQIEIPVPNAKARSEILKVIGKIPRDRYHSTLESIAARTHGFVGADLETLVEQAAISYYRRLRKSLEQEGTMMLYQPAEPEVELADMHDDLKNALSRVHPTAMQEIFVEVPDVRWHDIGGQHEVKQVLEEALVWPIKYPDDMAQHSVKQKKGLLLYGPPGCSKTMTAKAAATESGLNFIAVKGSELMSMYVGESERALRDVFSKARAVKPSLIFFDEIDAIGATRPGGEHTGVQTVTTLLNELDGFETLEGVFVLAASNKPEILDPALLRAGRLDTAIYVGLPNIKARGDILRMEMRTMQRGCDIDERSLSEMTRGYSGAEIVQLCENARYAALREQIDSQEKRWVCQRHFNIALAKAQKSVTPQMIDDYEAWGARRR